MSLIGKLIVDYVVKKGEVLEPRVHSLVGILDDKRPIYIRFKDMARKDDLRSGWLTVEVSARRSDQFGFEVLTEVIEGDYSCRSIKLHTGLSKPGLGAIDSKPGKDGRDLYDNLYCSLLDYVENCLRAGRVQQIGGVDK